VTVTVTMMAVATTVTTVGATVTTVGVMVAVTEEMAVVMTVATTAAIHPHPRQRRRPLQQDPSCTHLVS
jgi:hypothetical protein